ncbi:hypothetical protein JCM8547_001469 [Rhodosporidiobolus lusitaniae]
MASSELPSSSFDPPELPSLGRPGDASASEELSVAASTSSIDLPLTKAFGNSAASAPLDEEEDKQPLEEDEPVCRICLSGDGEGDDLGGLIVPCKCSGTARFVHRYCLTEWRTRDRQNGFYRCALCGERYRLRKTRWTRMAERRWSTPLLALFLLTLASIASGFFVDPLITASCEGRLDFNLSAWRHDFTSPSSPSSPSSLSPSTRFFLASPTHLLTADPTFGLYARYTNTSETWSLQSCIQPDLPAVASALSRLRSGEKDVLLWAGEREMFPLWAVRGVVPMMHLVEGLALFSLVLSVLAQLAFRWNLVALWTFPLTLGWPFDPRHRLRCGTAHGIMVMITLASKQASNPELLGWLRLLWTASGTFCIGMTIVNADAWTRDFTRALVKRSLGKTEVLDVRDVDEQIRRKQT